MRLVESGVRFVSLSIGGWDNHTDIFNILKTKQLPKLDGGVSALLTGLEQKGLLDSTAVFVTGEFGRTPKINTRATLGGRDHYPRCMFMLMAGGKVRGGQVIGESDATASGHSTMLLNQTMLQLRSITTLVSITSKSFTRKQVDRSRWYVMEIRSHNSLPSPPVKKCSKPWN